VAARARAERMLALAMTMARMMTMAAAALRLRFLEADEFAPHLVAMTGPAFAAKVVRHARTGFR